VDLWGLEAGILTDPKAVMGFGHSALYVETYDENGKSTGYDIYEVGATNNTSRPDETILSSEPIDRKQLIVAGIIGGSSVKIISPISSASSSAATVAVSSSFLPEAGVHKYHITSLDEIDQRFTNNVGFVTIKNQDELIRAEAEKLGKDFGAYNLLTNNCSQYVANSLTAGGIETSLDPRPNVATDYARDNNEGLIKHDKKNK
jgi:hypothetical protein